MAARKIIQIIDREKGTNRTSFTDPTPISTQDLFGPGPVRFDKVDYYCFIGVERGGVFRTEDYSGDSLQVAARRPGVTAESGVISGTIGGDAFTWDFRQGGGLSADQVKQSLDATSHVQSTSGSVRVAKRGTHFTIQGTTDGDLGAITIADSAIETWPKCDVRISTPDAGGASDREIQIVTIAETAIGLAPVSPDTFSAVAASTLTVSEESAGTANKYEVQRLSLSNFPDKGEIVLVGGPITGPVRFDIDASPSAIKTAINADTSGLVNKVERRSNSTNSYEWLVYFSSTGDQTLLGATSRTFVGTSHSGLNATLNFNLDSTELAFSSSGETELEAFYEVETVSGGSADSLFQDKIRISEGVIDVATLTNVNPATTYLTSVATLGSLEGDGTAADPLSAIQLHFDSGGGVCIDAGSSGSGNDVIFYDNLGTECLRINADNTTARFGVGYSVSLDEDDTHANPVAGKVKIYAKTTGRIYQKDDAGAEAVFVTPASTDTLTNKTINTASNTITVVEADVSDLGSYITASSTDTITNKTAAAESNTFKPYIETLTGSDTLVASECYNAVYAINGAGTVTLPAVALGMTFAIITLGAIAVSVDPNGSEIIVLDGTALTGGNKITNTSTAGDIAVFVGDSTAWVAVTNGWTDGGA